MLNIGCLTMITMNGMVNKNVIKKLKSSNTRNSLINAKINVKNFLLMLITAKKNAKWLIKCKKMLLALKILKSKRSFLNALIKFLKILKIWMLLLKNVSSKSSDLKSKKGLSHRNTPPRDLYFNLYFNLNLAILTYMKFYKN